MKHFILDRKKRDSMASLSEQVIPMLIQGNKHSVERGFLGLVVVFKKKTKMKQKQVYRMKICSQI